MICFLSASLGIVEMAELKNNRWRLIKHGFVFQCKLAIDALRDLLLSPISMACLFVDLVKGNSAEQSYFNKLMRFGHKTDIWLNLFSHGFGPLKENKSLGFTDSLGQEKIDTPFYNKIKIPKKPQPEVSELRSQSANIDIVFDKIEDLLKEQLAKGGLTASAKITIDRYLDSLSKKEHIKRASIMEHKKD